MQKAATLTWKELKQNYKAEYKAAVQELPKGITSDEKKARLEAWRHKFSYKLAKSRGTPTSDDD